MRAALRLLVIAPVVLSGCGTAPIALDYRPKTAAASIAPAPRVYVAPVVDRTTPETGDINTQLHFFGPLRTSVKTPYAQALHDALAAELALLGAAPAAAADSCDAVLEPVLTAVLVTRDEGGSFHVPLSAAFKFSLALKDKAGKPLWSGDVVGKGRGYESAPLLLRVGSGPNDALNAAFADALAQVGPALESAKVLSTPRAP